MRKFTKEITALLAAATVSASAGAISASSEEIEATAGVMVAPTEEYPAVDGGMMPPDDYIEQPDTTELVGTYTTTTTTTTTTIPPLMGTYTTSKATTTVTTTENLTTTTLIGTYTTCTTTTTIPPLAGVPLPPDDFIVTTNTTFPPLMGTFIPTTESTIATTTTTTVEIPPLMGDIMPSDGDINFDGEFGIADVVTMQKWMLGDKNVAIYDWRVADLYPDNKLDVFDVCLMKEKLLSDSSNNKNFTSLEFEITENVENVDFSQYNRNYGLMGGKEYYGMGYSAVKDEEGNEVKPEYYVLYTITAYPDYADGGQYVTRIEITDSNVMVYGLTVNSTIEEYDAVFSEMGYTTEVKEVGEYRYFTAKNDDGISYTFNEVNGNGNPMLTIQAEVTNREGIQY